VTRPYRFNKDTLSDTFTGGIYERHDEPHYNEVEGSAKYVLEVGTDCNVDLNMVALCIHIDEVSEFLLNSDSHIARLILKSMKNTKKDIEDVKRSMK